MNNIAHNISYINSRIAAACLFCGRNPKEVNYNTAGKELTDFTTYYTTLPIKGTQWNGTYTFSGYFNVEPSTTIYNAVKDKQAYSIAEIVAQYYNVMLNSGSVNNIEPQIDVLYQ